MSGIGLPPPGEHDFELDEIARKASTGAPASGTPAEAGIELEEQAQAAGEAPLATLEEVKRQGPPPAPSPVVTPNLTDDEKKLPTIKLLEKIAEHNGLKIFNAQDANARVVNFDAEFPKKDGKIHLETWPDDATRKAQNYKGPPMLKATVTFKAVIECKDGSRKEIKFEQEIFTQVKMPPAGASEREIHDAMLAAVAKIRGYSLAIENAAVFGTADKVNSVAKPNLSISIGRTHGGTVHHGEKLASKFRPLDYVQATQSRSKKGDITHVYVEGKKIAIYPFIPRVDWRKEQVWDETLKKAVDKLTPSGDVIWHRTLVEEPKTTLLDFWSSEITCPELEERKKKMQELQRLSAQLPDCPPNQKPSDFYSSSTITPPKSSQLTRDQITAKQFNETTEKALIYEETINSGDGVPDGMVQAIIKNTADDLDRLNRAFQYKIESPLDILAASPDFDRSKLAQKNTPAIGKSIRDMKKELDKLNSEKSALEASLKKINDTLGTQPPSQTQLAEIDRLTKEISDINSQKQLLQADCEKLYNQKMDQWKTYQSTLKMIDYLVATGSPDIISKDQKEALISQKKSLERHFAKFNLEYKLKIFDDAYQKFSNEYFPKAIPTGPTASAATPPPPAGAPPSAGPTPSSTPPSSLPPGAQLPPASPRGPGAPGAPPPPDYMPPPPEIQ